MRIGPIACLLAALPLLTACVGQVETRSIAPTDLTNGTELDGVVGYRAMQVMEVDELTQFSSDGKTFTTACVHTPSRKIVSIPDQRHPLLVSYHHGLLEGYVLGVTLNADGVITGVNSTSNPDQGKTLGNVSDAAANVAKLAAMALVRPGAPVKPPTTNCNSTPTFVDYEPPPTKGLQ